MSVIVTIDLGDGRMDSLKLTPNADLRQLAEDFCIKHKLPRESSEQLINEIRKSAPNLNNDTIPNISNSTNFTTKPTQSFPSNTGVKLYEKGKKYMEIIANKIQKFKKMREDNEKKNLTFSPAINKSNYASSVEILLKSGLQTEQKLEKMRGEKLNSEINECTFSPKINKRSEGLAYKRKSMTPDKEFSTSFESSGCYWNLIKLNKAGIHESLYQDARNRSIVRKKSTDIFYQTTFEFRPDLSATKDVSMKLLEKRGKYRRISDYRKEIEYYLRVKALNTDLSTGQELFKPKINQYPVETRRDFSPCRPHFTFNHFRNKLTSERSEKIVKRIRFLRFQTLFNTLCPENGKITKKSVRKASIEKYLRRLLDPILLNIENNDETMDFERFREEMEVLLGEMTPEDRHYIIKGEKPVILKAETSVLVEKSKSLTSTPIRFGIYERNLDKLKKTKGNIVRLRKKLKENDLRSCTFTPTTTRYNTPKKYPDIWSLKSNLNRSAYT